MLLIEICSFVSSEIIFLTAIRFCSQSIFNTLKQHINGSDLSPKNSSFFFILKENDNTRTTYKNNQNEHL